MNQDPARESKKAGAQEGLPNNVNHSTETLFFLTNTPCDALFLNEFVG